MKRQSKIVESLSSEVKRLKERLEEKEREFGILHRAFSTLSQKLNVMQEIQGLVNVIFDRESLLDKIMDIVIRALEVEAGSLLFIDENSQELYFQIAKGEKADAVKPFRLKLGEGIAGWVAVQNEPVAISEVYKDPRFKKDIDKVTGFETRSILAVPVRIGGRVKGVIEVLNKIHQDIFTSDDIDLLSVVASIMGKLLETAEILAERRKRKMRRLRKKS